MEKHRGGNGKAREVFHHLWVGPWKAEMPGLSFLPPRWYSVQVTEP